MKGNLNQLHKESFFVGQVRAIRLLYRSVPFLILAFFLTSCATMPKTISTTPAYEAVLPADSRIFILQPLLKFERLQDEVILDPSNFGGTSIVSSLNTTARNAVLRSKYQVAETEVMNAPEIVDLYSRLQSLSSRLAAGQLNDEADTTLQRLSALDQNLVILSHFLYAKVGRGGYWNPMSGAIGSSMSTSRLQVSLIRCSTGQVLWKNEVFLRQLPQVDNPKFAESLQLLYANFPGTKED